MIEGPRFVPARQDFIIPITPTPDYRPELPPHLKREDFTIPLTPTPNYYPELPYYLRKYVLKKIRFEEGTVPESLWNQRGDFIERGVQDMVAKLKRVKNVTRHKYNSEDDIAGHDLTVEFDDGFKVYVQVKSSRWGIKEYKQAIRDKYFPNQINNSALVDEWMSENGIILVNGSETRSGTEILNGSFYPQLEKIRQRHQIPAIEPKIDIGQLAFSGSANPDDAVRWIKQNPQS